MVSDRREWERIQATIESANSLETLRNVHYEVFSRLREEMLKPEASHGMTDERYRQLSDIHDRMIEKALHMAKLRVEEEGAGEAPESLSWLIMGSGGRHEQTVWSDQDNGLIYRISSGQDPERVRCYVERLAEAGVENLREIGYPLCPGNVMATNARWCKTLDGWKAMLTQWAKERSVDDIRYFLIASDFRKVFGDDAPADELREWLSALALNTRSLILRLAEHATVYEVPIGIFGQIFTEQWGPYTGKLDLKHGLYVHAVNGIRMLSFAYDVRETSTLERLQRLRSGGKWDAGDIGELERAFTFILYLRLVHHLKQETEEALMDHHIRLQSLSADELRELKQAMRSVKRLQHKIKKTFLRSDRWKHTEDWNHEDE